MCFFTHAQIAASDPLVTIVWGAQFVDYSNVSRKDSNEATVDNGGVKTKAKELPQRTSVSQHDRLLGLKGSAFMNKAPPGI